MLELITKELNSTGAFKHSVPPILDKIVKAIPNEQIPYRMKLTIAVTELILFMSQFRRNIDHWNGSSIPINVLAFSLARSGDGKDSSVNIARKCFSQGYHKLNEVRKRKAKDLATEKAAADGVADPNDWAQVKPYYKPPNPLFVAPSTTEGFIKHLNELDESGIGSGFIYSGEFGSELLTSSVIISNLQLLAEVYDEGKKEVKVLKAAENQSKEITNLPVSALFVGSQDNILFDDNIKNKFKTEFTTKLARRSFFNFNKEVVRPATYNSVAELLKAEIKMEDDAKAARVFVDNEIGRIADTHLLKTGVPIKVDNDTRELFLMYKRYNTEVAESISQQYPISKLVRKHMQWKALKLAGAIAMADGKDSISKSHYISSISFVELLNDDMFMFEQELIKEPYELFSVYMHETLENNKSFASLHMLKKLGYIQGTGAIGPKVKELIKLVSSYDESGIYTDMDNGIQFEKIIKTNACGISYLEVSGTKEERAYKCAEGYTYVEVSFEDLGNMLKGDYAYSPFEFKDGIKGKDNIISGAKWICLDIDKSNITDEEAHQLLNNFNHHIVRTSNEDNAFKFRILLELDSYVNVENIMWKAFIKSITDFISITADPLPKSQAFFSYAGRNVLSVTNANTIEVRDHLLLAHDSVENKVEPAKLPKAQQQALLNDPLTTFSYAFEAQPGGRSLSLIRAAKHAKDLGLSNEGIMQLITDINDYWDIPMDTEEIDRTIFSQVRRW